MQEPRWTLDELAERVEAALAVDYQGQASGRVRAVPDRRAIRWYTTIGLVDRPAAHRGRTALYGPRHLLQLVAVKRLQARGLPLVSIQQELAGATDTQLARVARLPAGVAAGPLPPRAAVAARSGADTMRPPAAARTAAAVRGPAGATARRARFWREQPAAALTAATDADATTPTDPTRFTGPAVPTGPTHAAQEEAGTAWAATLQGVRLGDGATLLLEPGRRLGPEDVRAVLDAAGPLLATLRDRGLGAGAQDPDQGRGARIPDQEPEARRAGGNEPRREHP
jgi:DNA-binding transcriptional MerR regulator